MDVMEWAIKALSKWRYSPLILPLIFLGVLLGSFYFPLPDGISASIQTRGIIGLIASFAITAIFWRFQQPPTVKNGHVGIIIAVRSEDEKTKGRISKDFVATCKILLEESRVYQPFQLIELNNFFSEMATDNASADELRMRCRGAFLLFGDTVQRRERGKNQYVLRLRGLVSHAPISPNNQSILAQEMFAVLPLKKSILEENELSEFEITTIQLAEATKYIIATSALLSHDFELAIALLEELQQAKKRLKINANIKAIKKLIELIPRRLADAYRFASLVHFSRWEVSRDENELKDSINWRVKYNNLVPADTLELLLLRAIEQFVFNRDIVAAINYIKESLIKS